jgi:hypothetical protein
MVVRSKYSPERQILKTPYSCVLQCVVKMTKTVIIQPLKKITRSYEICITVRDITPILNISDMVNA